MLFLSLLNYQNHPLQSCPHFIFSGAKSAFPPGMIRDPIFCVLTSLINYSRIGKCKCPCAFVDHELLRIFKSLFSAVCPQHMIQNRHLIHTSITKWKCRWSGEEWLLGYSGNFTFLQGDTWTVSITSIWLPKPPRSTLSRILRWAKTILGPLCAYFVPSYTASLWCPQSPQTLMYSMPWGLDNIPGHQFPLLPNQNFLMSLRASYHSCRAHHVPNALY